MAGAPVVRTSDVVVVGGGVVGLSVAVHLRWLGATVTLLERDRIGQDQFLIGLVPATGLAARLVLQ